MLRPDKWGLQFYFLMLTFLSPPDPFNDWGGGGRGCNNFVPVFLRGRHEKKTTEDIFDQHPGGMS